MKRIAPPRKSPGFFAGFWRDRRAGAAAELALILPGIAYIVLNVADLGLYVYSKMQVDLAAQEAAGAARTACVDSTKLPATINCANLGTTMQTAAQAASTLGSGVTLTSTVEKYYCADDTGTLVEVATPPTAPPADCSSVYATVTASPPGDYIQATVSYPFSSLFPGASIAQLLPSTITRTAWMRLQ